LDTMQRFGARWYDLARGREPRVCDEGEESERGGRGAQDGEIGPPNLGLDAEVGAGFLEGDIDLPTADEPSEDVDWRGVEIDREKGLQLKLAGGSRTKSQRIGTGGLPEWYQTAVPLAISTMRWIRPYHRATV
jgi:hypothetical protein